MAKIYRAPFSPYYDLHFGIQIQTEQQEAIKKILVSSCSSGDLSVVKEQCLYAKDALESNPALVLDHAFMVARAVAYRLRNDHEPARAGEWVI